MMNDETLVMVMKLHPTVCSKYTILMSHTCSYMRYLVLTRCVLFFSSLSSSSFSLFSLLHYTVGTSWCVSSAFVVVLSVRATTTTTRVILIYPAPNRSTGIKAAVVPTVERPTGRPTGVAMQHRHPCSELW